MKILDGPNAGKQPAIGAQVFPGFRPSDAGTHSRSNISTYVDVERPHGAVAGVRGGALRELQRLRLDDDRQGRDAPEGREGLQLPWRPQHRFPRAVAAPVVFSSTATNFINGVPFEVRTFP